MKTFTQLLFNLIYQKVRLNRLIDIKAIIKNDIRIQNELIKKIEEHHEDGILAARTYLRAIFDDAEYRHERYISIWLVKLLAEEEHFNRVVDINSTNGERVSFSVEWFGVNFHLNLKINYTGSGIMTNPYTLKTGNIPTAVISAMNTTQRWLNEQDEILDYSLSDTKELINRSKSLLETCRISRSTMFIKRQFLEELVNNKIVFINSIPNEDGSTRISYKATLDGGISTLVNLDVRESFVLDENFNVALASVNRTICRRKVKTNSILSKIKKHVEANEDNLSCLIEDLENFNCLAGSSWREEYIKSFIAIGKIDKMELGDKINLIPDLLEGCLMTLIKTTSFYTL